MGYPHLFSSTPWHFCGRCHCCTLFPHFFLSWNRLGDRCESKGVFKMGTIRCGRRYAAPKLELVRKNRTLLAGLGLSVSELLPGRCFYIPDYMMARGRMLSPICRFIYLNFVLSDLRNPHFLGLIC